MQYNLTETTQLEVDLVRLWQAIVHEKPIPQLDELLEASYKLNVRLMRSGSTMFRRFHNERLATDIVAAALEWQVDDWTSQGPDAPEDSAMQDTDDGDSYSGYFIDSLCIVQGICAGICNPNDLGRHKNKSYIPILFKDNNRKPVLRLYFNNPDKPRVGVFNPAGEEKIEKFATLEDITSFARRIRSRVRALQAVAG